MRFAKWFIVPVGAALVVITARDGLAQCVGCVVGCTSLPAPAYQGCRTFPSQTGIACLAWLPCPGGGFGGGAPGDWNDDPPPRLASPGDLPGGAELSFYELIYPLAPGADPLAGATSRVVRGAVRPFSVAAANRALAGIAAGAAPELTPLTGAVTVGLGHVEGAFGVAGGYGYAERLARTALGVSVSVCAVEGNAVSGSLARETIQPGDVLFVRVKLDRECVLALSPFPTGQTSLTRQGQVSLARERFLDELRVAIAAGGGHPPLLELLPVKDHACP
jgi:hypothetical protein